LLLGIGLCLATPLILVAAGGDLDVILIGYAIALFWLVPLCFIFAWTHRDYMYRKGGAVLFDGAVLSYSKILDGSDVRYSAPLRECSYWRGNSSWMTVQQNDRCLDSTLGTGDVLLIQFPDRFQMEQTEKNEHLNAVPVIVAVGRMPESRRYWEEVLWRESLRHNEEYEFLPPPWSFAFKTVMQIAVLLISLYCGLQSWGIVQYFLEELNVPKDIAFQISYTLMLGFLLYPAVVLLYYIDYLIGEAGRITGRCLQLVYARSVYTRGIWRIWFVIEFYSLLPLLPLLPLFLPLRNNPVNYAVSAFILGSVLNALLALLAACAIRCLQDGEFKKQEK
jgi:hypothetical protein